MVAKKITRKEPKEKVKKELLKTHEGKQNFQYRKILRCYHIMLKIILKRLLTFAKLMQIYFQRSE